MAGTTKDMSLASKVTEIYCMADDFCKEFTLQQKKFMVEDRKQKRRNKPNRMSDARLWLFLSCSTPVASAASSITTRNMSVNI